MSAVILPPSGEPFEIVGTAEVRGREQAGRIDTLEDAAITRKEELEAAEEAYQVAMNDRFLPTQRERAEAAVERCAELMKLCGMAATTIERLADIVVGDHPGAGVCNHEREQATELRVKSQGMDPAKLRDRMNAARPLNVSTDGDALAAALDEKARIRAHAICFKRHPDTADPCERMADHKGKCRCGLLSWDAQPEPAAPMAKPFKAAPRGRKAGRP